MAYARQTLTRKRPDGTELEAATRALEEALQELRAAMRSGTVDLAAARRALDAAEDRLRLAREKLQHDGDGRQER